MARCKRRFVDQALLDRISDLPSNLLDCILSRMPIRDAVRTSLLSRKWRHRWTAVREIVFDKNFVEGAVELRISDTDSSKEIKKYEYCRVIDRFLLVHAGPIYRFVLHVPTFGDPAQSIDITQWILVISQKGVKDLVIDASGSIDALRSYVFTVKLPSYLYRCTELKHLKLCICELSPPPKSFMGFCNLVSLELVDVCTRGHAIAAFISQCPVLEKLSLTLIPHRPVPAHPFPLSVCAPNLKTLRIRDCRFTTLSLKSCPKLVTLSLEGVLSLSLSSADENSSNLDEIFISSLKVEDVTLSNFALIALAQHHIPRQLPIPLADHTRLTLLCVDTLSLKQVKCVFCILRSSPNLKTLNISVASCAADDDEAAIECIEAQGKESNNLISVVTVKIRGVEGRRTEIVLIKTLLACAPMLDTIQLQTDYNVGDDSELKILKELIQFSRLSSKAKIVCSKFSKQDAAFSFE